MKVFIDPSCDIHYASYYIYGLYEFYGKTKVYFSSKYFKPFKHDNHFFAFVINDRTTLKKIVIDFTDSSIIDSKALQWCDVYGKINLDDSQVTDRKVIPIGPSFGIHNYNAFETLWYGITNLLKAYHRIPNKRKFLSDYKAQYYRPKLSNYSSSYKVKDYYVFFMASLWKQEGEANTYRAHFIESCKDHPNIQFEGGFAPRTKNDIQGFETLTTSGRIDVNHYLEKTKQSEIVFNTPAVKSCHGWKLAEYLCLGKAILSTPLSRQLPSVLEDRNHLLFTDGSKADISHKINAILTDTDLKERLEVQAKVYFNRFLSPVCVIKKLTD